MKKKFYIKSTLLSLAVMALLNSCLKDPRYVDFSKVGTLVELPLTEFNDGGTGGVLQSASYSISSPSDTLVVAVNVASPKPLTSALNVTLSTTDTTVLHANAPGSVVLPSADYTVIGGNTVTVPANQRLAYFKVIIHAAAIGVVNSGVYTLPITIESASGQPIAQPYKGILYNISVTP